MSNKISEIQKRKKRQNNTLVIIMGVILFAIAAHFAYANFFQEKPKEKMPISTFHRDVGKNEIAKIGITPDYLTQGFEVEKKNGTKYEVEGPFLEMKIVRELSDSGVEVLYKNAKTDYRALPSYLMLGFISIFILMQFGQTLGISFMKASTQSDVKFKDVAGNEEAKAAMREVVDYLKNPNAFEDIGAKFPAGLIMDGPPGTGKTLLAKAIAGEAGANFLAVSGSDFSSMFVGVSGMKVRGMFSRARRLAPCVMFIDEIDAIGGHRLNEGSATAREMGSTLNSLLVQMDGFEANSGVVVIAATNRIELLDTALLRSGRFDRHIHIQVPSLHERTEILQIHGQKLKLSSNFDYTAVARACIGMSGADLANVMNQSALIAVREGATEVETKHAHKGRDRVVMGDARHSQAKSMNAKTKKILAVHEVGHAVVGIVHGQDKVTRISIIPRGQSLGQTMMNPDEEILVHERSDLISKIRLLLGGRAAELVVGKTETTGASDDLKRASQLAIDMIGKYGMSPTHLLAVNERSSDELKKKIETEANDLLESCLNDAIATINQHREIFDEIVEVLIEVEEIDEEGADYYSRKILGLPAPESKELKNKTDIDVLNVAEILPGTDSIPLI